MKAFVGLCKNRCFSPLSFYSFHRLPVILHNILKIKVFENFNFNTVIPNLILLGTCSFYYLLSKY